MEEVPERRGVFILVAVLDVEQTGHQVTPGEELETLANRPLLLRGSEFLEPRDDTFLHRSPEELNVVVAFEDDDLVAGKEEIDDRPEQDRVTVDDLIDLKHAGSFGAPEPIGAVHVAFGYPVRNHFRRRGKDQDLEKIKQISIDDQCRIPIGGVVRQEVPELLVPEEVLRRSPDTGLGVFAAGQMEIGDDKIAP